MTPMRLLILAALAVLPASLAAQSRLEGIPVGSGDIERLNPARVVVSHRKQLNLSKSQMATLDSLRKAFAGSAGHLADTVKRSHRAITTPPPMLRRPPEGKPESRKDSLERVKLDSTNRVKRDRYFEVVTTGRRDLAAALLALKDAFDGCVESTTLVLTADQRNVVALALERASEEFTRRLRLANIR